MVDGSMGDGRASRSKPSGVRPWPPLVAAAAIALATAALMLAYESAKELLVPGLSKWQSHTITICFAGAFSGFAGLAVARRLHAANLALERSHDETRALLRELQHRVKNSFAMISSLASLTEAGARSEEAKRLLAEIGARIGAVSEMYDMLYSSDSTTEVDLDDYLSRIARILAGDGRLLVRTELSAGRAATAPAVLVGLVVTELMTNAVKHAFPGGRSGEVRLRAERGPEGLSLVLSDDGVGMPDDLGGSAVKSMGLTIVRTLVDQLEGSCEVSSDGGTRWELRIPEGSIRREEESAPRA